MLLFALACAPTALTVGEPPVVDSSDTGSVVDDTGPAPDPEPDLTIWNGTRELSGDCDATLTEQGQALEASWDYYDWLESECPGCDVFYLVEVSPSQVCGLQVTQEVLRGLDLDAPDAVEVYGFDNRGAQLFDDEGQLDGLELRYGYRLEVQGGAIDVDGRVSFPAL